MAQKLNMNQTQQNSLNQSIEKAREILNSVNNPTDALQKANVDPGFLSKVREYINNPMYSLLLPMIGIDKNVALQKLDSLEKMLGKDKTINITNESTQSSQVGGDDLERFKRGLKAFK
jgi:hypothetical protein